ncbi:MAG: alanine--tRNA ligase [Candidatus Zambryskibacteria bacterium]|nr:alanine--tRNA ligase [Candidatus Zambryskibacteria bacterium]
MTARELREKYLEFFRERGHAIIPSSSLIPENDPTVLFTTAGMHPLVPYLLGEKCPKGNRLVNVQKCIRTGDIEEVGDDTHLTFFEMLGNWSLGDYWKEDSIKWSLEFLTKELDIAVERISVTCFEGDEQNNILRDTESAEIWKSLGIPEDKIKFLGKENNWWGPAGVTGPCGPDTEIFVDGVEVWNNVFMQYNKTADGKYEPLKQKNVDTGMGLERTLMILNGQKNVFETDVFYPLMDISRGALDTRAKKIVADHIKAATFILAEGVVPGNTGRDYVLRRLIRRAVRYGADFSLAEKVIEIYKDVYPELLKNKEKILESLKTEKEKFDKTLKQGMREFNWMLKTNAGEKILPSSIVFELVTSHGFPFELVKEIAKEQGKIIEEEKFWNKMKAHQELSRTASAGMFKGGLADGGEETKKLHTATHLLRQALEIVLGEPIMQKGSNINAERLRFDFGFARKLTDEEKNKVEDLVNKKIAENLPVNKVIMKLAEAEKTGAAHTFGDKYGDEVSIYFVGDNLETAWSKEFCGGPHVENTGKLGHFKIIKEEASSAGIRRIKAILE